jgi:glycerol-3-phosphate acyltransferase PlsX
MGTDGAPAPEVEGTLGALGQLDDDVEVILVGDEDAVEAQLELHGDIPRERLGVIDAPDRVRADDPPATVVRRRPDSSIVRGLRLQAAGEVDAFVSAGSTGAVMAASLFILRRLEGVERPAVGTVLPTAGDPVLLLDSGANVDCKPVHLAQFAHLGHIYAQDMLGVERPRVGLLNIGEEPGKGDELAQETHRLLRGDPGLHFVGNVEGREIIEGRCDVLVADGFVGNVLLKFYESVAQFIIGLLQNALEAEGGSAPALDLQEVFRVLDYSEYGGAPLLGVNGVTIICHGGSPPKAIRNAILEAVRSVRAGMVQHLAGDLASASTFRTPA